MSFSSVIDKTCCVGSVPSRVLVRKSGVGDVGRPHQTMAWGGMFSPSHRYISRGATQLSYPSWPVAVTTGSPIKIFQGMTVRNPRQALFPKGGEKNAWPRLSVFEYNSKPQGAAEMRYENLTRQVRESMVEEKQTDETLGKLYLSPRLSSEGRTAWPKVLYQAIAKHDDGWLSTSLRSRGLLNRYESRRRPKGGTIEARVPSTAEETLAEGEFNRYYVRAICRAALANGEDAIEVYRGKDVENPRSRSLELVGRRFNPENLLKDLRDSVGLEPALGIPPGPNSGLTIRRIREEEVYGRN